MCIRDRLIADSRRSDLTEPSPQQKAMAELLGTDLINIPDSDQLFQGFQELNVLS